MNTPESDGSDGFSFSSLGDLIGGIGSGVGSILGAGRNSQASQQAAAANAQATTLKSFLPWIAGGVVVLVAVVFLARK